MRGLLVLAVAVLAFAAPRLDSRVDGVYNRTDCEGPVPCRGIFPETAKVAAEASGDPTHPMYNFTVADAVGAIDLLTGEVVVRSPSVRCAGIMQSNPIRAVLLCFRGTVDFDVTYACAGGPCKESLLF